MAESMSQSANPAPATNQNTRYPNKIEGVFDSATHTANKPPGTIWVPSEIKLDPKKAGVVLINARGRSAQREREACSTPHGREARPDVLPGLSAFIS